MATPTSPDLKQVSTINNDIRIGRSPSTVGILASGLANSRINRSPNPPVRRISHDSPPLPQLPEMTNEQVFDLMEKEQDKIVVKMTREISQLQEELKALRSQNTSRNRRSSSISSNASLEIPRGDSHACAPVRRSSSSSQTHLLSPAQLQEMALENTSLKNDIQVLRRENEALRREVDHLRAQFPHP